MLFTFPAVSLRSLFFLRFSLSARKIILCIHIIRTSPGFLIFPWVIFLFFDHNAAVCRKLDQHTEKCTAHAQAKSIWNICKSSKFRQGKSCHSATQQTGSDDQYNPCPLHGKHAKSHAKQQTEEKYQRSRRMENIDSKSQSDTCTDNKNSDLIAQKSEHCEQNAHTDHDHCVHIFFLDSHGIRHTKPDAASDQETEQHHPEPEQPVSQHAVDHAKDKKSCKSDRGNAVQN